MSDRSIAEILGWSPVRLVGDDQIIRWQAPDVDYSDGSPPTVDDLLAFLACDVFFEAELIVANGFVSVEFKNTDSGLDGDTFDSDTLLAALEAAVRAVGSRSPDGGVADDGTTTDGETP